MLNLENIFPDETAEILEKGKSFSIGTVRNWGGRDWIKVSEGKWAIRENLKLRLPTIERFKKDGKWTEERKSLHEKIIDSYVNRAKKSDNPTVILMMGAPGSGKGTLQRYLKENGKMPKELLSVDPDEIKTKSLKRDFDEYSKFNKVKASSRVHEEGSYLAKEIIKRVSEIKSDFLIDKVFSEENKLRQQVKGLVNKGYKVKIIMASLPKEIGFQRALERARRSGRFIDKKSASVAYDNIETTFNNIFENPPEGVSEINQFDTNVRIGESPKLKKNKRYDKTGV